MESIKSAKIINFPNIDKSKELTSLFDDPITFSKKILEMYKENPDKLKNMLKITIPYFKKFINYDKEKNILTLEVQEMGTNWEKYYEKLWIHVTIYSLEIWYWYACYLWRVEECADWFFLYYPAISMENAKMQYALIKSWNMRFVYDIKNINNVIFAKINHNNVKKYFPIFYDANDEKESYKIQDNIEDYNWRKYKIEINETENDFKIIDEKNTDTSVKYEILENGCIKILR